MAILQGKDFFLTIAAGILLLSVLLMIIVIPGVYTKTIPNENNLNAVIGISLAILIRLLIFGWYLIIIRKISRKGEKSKTACMIIGILLFIFGFIYSDGAFAFLNNKDIIYISYLMFTSVFFDIIASILTFIAIFKKSQKLE